MINNRPQFSEDPRGIDDDEAEPDELEDALIELQGWDSDDEITPDTVVSLSAKGRAMWEQLLSECSAIAGRSIDGDELGKVFKQVRKEMNCDEPDFHDQTVMACFHKHLRGSGEH